MKNRKFRYGFTTSITFNTKKESEKSESMNSWRNEEEGYYYWLHHFKPSCEGDTESWMIATHPDWDKSGNMTHIERIEKKTLSALKREFHRRHPFIKLRIK